MTSGFPLGVAHLYVGSHWRAGARNLSHHGCPLWVQRSVQVMVAVAVVVMFFAKVTVPSFGPGLWPQGVRSGG